MLQGCCSASLEKSGGTGVLGIRLAAVVPSYLKSQTPKGLLDEGRTNGDLHNGGDV